MTVTQTIYPTSIVDAMGFWKFLTKARKQKVRDLFNKVLPLPLIGNEEVYRFLFALTIAPMQHFADTKFTGVIVTAKQLSRFNKLYKPSANPLKALGFEGSLFQNLIDFKIICTDNHFINALYTKEIENLIMDSRGIAYSLNFEKFSPKIIAELYAILFESILEQLKGYLGNAKPSANADTLKKSVKKLNSIESIFETFTDLTEKEYRKCLKSGKLSNNFISVKSAYEIIESIVENLRNLDFRKNWNKEDTRFTASLFSKIMDYKKEEELRNLAFTATSDEVYYKVRSDGKRRRALTNWKAINRGQEKALSGYDLDLLQSVVLNHQQISKLVKCLSSSAIIDGVLAVHKADLKVGYTGRIYEVKGFGTTGFKKIIKEKNYREMEKALGSKIYNYDLVNSQLNILSDFSTKFNLGYDGLKTYLSDRNNRRIHAENLSVSEKTFKNLILAITFGAGCSLEDFVERNNSTAYGFLTTENIVSKSDRLSFYIKFIEECGYFIQDIAKWINQDCLEVLTENFKSGVHPETGETLYSNGCHRIPIGDTLTNNKKISAFLLQGQETAFICSIINRLENYGIELLSYEFDGLVVNERLPEALIQEVRELYNMGQNIRLEVKEFI